MTEIKTGEVIVKDAAFHSEQEVYFESTDIDEMYMKMKNRVIENLTVFQRGQSGWRFRSIVIRPICWCCLDRGPGSFDVEDATTLSWSSAAVSE